MKQLPPISDITAWVRLQDAAPSSRQVARAFGIKGALKRDLFALLDELQEEGKLSLRQPRSRRGGAEAEMAPGDLPPVSLLRITGLSADGEPEAEPLEWRADAPRPQVLVLLEPGAPALGTGDRILARLKAGAEAPYSHTARLIRAIGANPRRILGIFRAGAEGGRLQPVDKGDSREWRVPEAQRRDARDGDLVEAEQSGPRDRLGLPQARIVEVLGDPGAPRAVSLIAIHQHGIPTEFDDAAIAEADAAEPPVLGSREDLRDLPLITIDPADARDRDDAIWAHPDTEDPRNAGGHIVWVAIADVAAYVRPGSALDAEARKRGNSSYFPDRVVPMLPDRLSGDLCSLHAGIDRACVAVRMQISADGALLAHRFTRGLMRSVASLSYDEVHRAVTEAPDAHTAPLMTSVIEPLFAAYAALKRGRHARQPLELDLPERKVVLGEDGTVTSVRIAERHDAHRLVEECMVLANVAAAQALVAHKVPQLFRVHEEPPPEKIDSLREVAQAAGLVLAKGQVLKTAHLNALLAAARDSDESELIHMATLRAMTQAYYARANLGHFGLALRAYAHFTSPIRRYADLIVHRALITAHGWGEDGLSEQDIARLDSTATHISETERRSMMAERDTNDRYLAAFLTERIGEAFAGRITGVAKFGVFVRLDETGAEGLIPVRTLGGEYFRFDREAGTLTGVQSGTELTLGQKVTVHLTDAAPVTGGLLLELVSLEGKARKPARGRAGKRRGAPPGARSGPRSGPGSGARSGAKTGTKTSAARGKRRTTSGGPRRRHRKS